MSEEMYRVFQVVIAAVGIPLVAASLIYMMRQTRHSARQLEVANRVATANIYQNVASQMIGVDRLFIERPELRPHFYRAEDTASGEEASRVQCVAELLIDLMDDVMTQKPCLPEYPWGAWETYFKYLLRSSPALREYWSKHRDWYSSEIAGFLDPIVAACTTEDPDSAS